MIKRLAEGLIAEDPDAVLRGETPREAKEPLTLAQFFREAWPIIEPGTPLTWNWHIDALADHLTATTERRIRNLLVTVPPRFTKSTLVSIAWPCWSWTKDPSLRFLFASYSSALSLSHAVTSRRLLESPWYHDRWGMKFSMTSDQNIKCLAKGTLVHLADGALVPVEELGGGESILSWDGHRIVVDKIQRVVDSGVQHVRRITLCDGTVLEATEIHRLRGWDSWVKVADMKVGDPLAVAVRLPPCQGDLSAEDAFLLALWLSEGTKGATSYHVTTASEPILARLREIASKRGWAVRRGDRYGYWVSCRKYKTGDTPLNLLRKHGLWGQKTDAIRIPDAVFRASDAVVGEFLSTYIACDGTVVAKQNFAIQVTSISERLIRDLCCLVKRFGARANIRSRPSWYVVGGVRKEARESWHLYIGGTESILSLSKLSIYGKEQAFEKLIAEKRRDARHRNGRTACIPPAWRKVLPGYVDPRTSGWASREIVKRNAIKYGDAALLGRIDSGIEWRKIASIEPGGKVQTFDVQTERHGCFFVDGVLSHNSFYENNKRGYRISTSVGGAATGLGADFIVCLPGDQQLRTSSGWYPIERIFNERIADHVASFDHESGEVVFRKILRYDRNPGRPLVEIKTERGTLRCTTDHRVHVVGRGDVRAEQLRNGDSLLELQEMAAAPVRVVSVSALAVIPPHTYNLEVEGTHNYFANGVCVSNCDDPHNLEEIHSEPIRKGVIKWYREVLSTRLNDQQTGCKVTIMQRGHNDDLAAYLIENEANLDHLTFPNEFEGDKTPTSIGWVDPRIEIGELLCPDRLGKEMTESLRVTLGEVAYSSQFQQRPVPLGGGIFKRDSFKRYRKAELPDTVDMIVISWDMSFKETTDSDFVAGQVWGFSGVDAYLLDRVYERASFTKTLSMVLAVDRKWPQAVVTVVEDKANGSAIVDTLKKSIAGLIAVTPEGGKIARANAVAPKIEAGNVHVPAHAVWVEPFLDNVSAFPLGKYDDDVDAMTQALIRYYHGHGGFGFLQVRS